MDLQEYISSGMLEAYALGALSPEERLEVEAVLMEHPQARQELADIEKTLEQHLQQYAAPAPAALKDAIWSQLSFAQDPPAASWESNGSARQIPLGKPAASSSGAVWQRAAVWIALAGSLAVNASLWNKSSQFSKTEVAANGQLDSLRRQNARLESIALNARLQDRILADTAMRSVSLLPGPRGGQMSATLFANKSTGETFLSIHRLPEPPKGMQYQLWIIRDGKPVDMGVIPNEYLSNALIQKVSYHETGGQAYAISLEKEGGSEVPTMENIYVIGKV